MKRVLATSPQFAKRRKIDEEAPTAVRQNLAPQPSRKEDRDDSLCALSASDTTLSEASPGSASGAALPAGVACSDTESKLARLDHALSAVVEQCEAATKLAFHARDLKTPADLEVAKAALSQFGLVVLLDAISTESVAQAHLHLRAAIARMWKSELGAEVCRKLCGGTDSIQATLDPFRNSGHHFGNASFGYLYKQPPHHSKYEQVVIEDKVTLFDQNAVYGSVVLPLLTHESNRHSTCLLLSLTHVNGMVSWDSVKLSCNPSPKPRAMTRQTLTKMHVDIYDASVERCQAIDNVDSGSTKLFYVPGTHLPHVRRLMEELCGARIMGAQGFVSLESHRALTRLLEAHAVAAPPYARAIWKSGVVHFEGRAASTPISKNCVTRSLFACADRKDTPNQPRFRIVVGTHVPHGLSRHALAQLASAASFGMCPAMYHSANRGIPVDANIVNRKTTQWKVPRNISEAERTRMREALREARELSNHDLERSLLNRIGPLHCHLMGVTQPLHTLGFGDEDLELLQACLTAEHCTH